MTEDLILPGLALTFTAALFLAAATFGARLLQSMKRQPRRIKIAPRNEDRRGLPRR